MSKEVGAGGRFDIFLDSAFNIITTGPLAQWGSAWPIKIVKI